MLHDKESIILLMPKGKNNIVRYKIFRFSSLRCHNLSACGRIDTSLFGTLEHLDRLTFCFQLQDGV